MRYVMWVLVRRKNFNMMKTIIGADVPEEGTAEEQKEEVRGLTFLEFVKFTTTLVWRWLVKNKLALWSFLGSTFIMVALMVGWIMSSLIWP